MRLSFPVALVLALLANLVPAFNRRPVIRRARK
jgi:hypothetical protein